MPPRSAAVVRRGPAPRERAPPGLAPGAPPASPDSAAARCTGDPRVRDRAARSGPPRRRWSARGAGGRSGACRARAPAAARE